MEDMKAVFDTCDVMAVPAGSAAAKLDSPEVARTDVILGYAGGPKLGHTGIGNLVGMPAIVIPCGSTAQAPLRPLGIQFYAKPFDESMLFRVSHAFESSSHWHKLKPSLSARLDPHEQSPRAVFN
jgi:Asp-tRNA(Asn)/Glu-tRNA(Gln) amidotransferase A subunit family amidase